MGEAELIGDNILGFYASPILSFILRQLERQCSLDVNETFYQMDRFWNNNQDKMDDVFRRSNEDVRIGKKIVITVTSR